MDARSLSRLVLLVALASGGCSRDDAAPDPRPVVEEPSAVSSAPAAPVEAAAEPPSLPVLLRIKNDTKGALDDVFLMAGSLRTFGPLQPGETSAYLPFASMSQAPHVGVSRGGRYIERLPSGAAQRLTIGRYTLGVGDGDDGLTTRLTREEGVPSREELNAAFRAAEERMTESLARAYAFTRRADTLRCGAAAKATGRAVLSFFVAPSGRTGGVTVVSEPHRAAPLGPCLIEAAKGWRLPRYHGEMPPALRVEVLLSDG